MDEVNRNRLEEFRQLRQQKNPGDVDENNHFTSVGNCGRRQKWRYTWGYVDQL